MDTEPGGGPAERDRAAAVSHGVPGQYGGRVPRGPDATFLLVFNDPRDPSIHYDLGWSLVAWEGSRRCWSTTLTGQGVQADDTVERAKAAAEDVLAAHHVLIDRWLERDGPAFRAVPPTADPDASR